jgi:hypothetical protein
LEGERPNVNDDNPQSSIARLEKALAENNRRLSNIQFSLKLISFWLLLIFLVLIIEYGDDVRAALKGWSAVTRTMLKD